MTESSIWKVGARVTLIDGTTYERQVGSIKETTAKTLLINLDGKEGPPVRVPKSSARILSTKLGRKGRTSNGNDEVPSLLNAEESSSTSTKKTNGVVFEPIMSPVQVIKGTHEGKHGIVEKETDKMVTIQCEGERIRVLKSSVKKQVHRVTFASPTPSPPKDGPSTMTMAVPPSELRPVKLFGGERRKSLENAIQTTSRSMQSNKLLVLSIVVVLAAASVAGKYFVDYGSITAYTSTMTGFDLDSIVSTSADFSSRTTEVVHNATSLMIITALGLQKIVKDAVSLNWIPTPIQ